MKSSLDHASQRAELANKPNCLLLKQKADKLRDVLCRDTMASSQRIFEVGIKVDCDQWADSWH